VKNNFGGADRGPRKGRFTETEQEIHAVLNVTLTKAGKASLQIKRLLVLNANVTLIFDICRIDFSGNADLAYQFARSHRTNVVATRAWERLRSIFGTSSPNLASPQMPKLANAFHEWSVVGEDSDGVSACGAVRLTGILPPHQLFSGDTHDFIASQCHGLS
jgi:hypothetical protein